MIGANREDIAVARSEARYDSKLWRNAFRLFPTFLVTLLALSHSAQSARIAAGFLSVFDVAALIADVVAVLVLLFSGAEGEQKLSRQCGPSASCLDGVSPTTGLPMPDCIPMSLWR